MTTQTVDAYKELLVLLNRMDDLKLRYVLRHTRPDSVTVLIFVPGEIWEVDFVDYGDEVHVEVEVYRGGGVTGDEATLEELFAKWEE